MKSGGVGMLQKRIVYRHWYAGVCVDARCEVRCRKHGADDGDTSVNEKLLHERERKKGWMQMGGNNHTYRCWSDAARMNGVCHQKKISPICAGR